MSDLNKSSRGILQEISNYVPTRNKDELIENRAQHVISSAIYLFEMLEEQYTDDELDQLTRRFFSSIKGNDPRRFTRAINRIKESKENAK